jgi:RNA polymerase sigma-70 factor, ECF subfamily
MTGAEGEPDVVEAARRGDRAAWEQLYRRLYPRLRSYLARRVGYEGAEDAVSETVTKAIEGIQHYADAGAGFDGWVFGIARHVSADHHRRFARDLRQHGLAHHIDGHGPEKHVPVEHGLDMADDHARLRSMFSRLDPAEQEILELRVVAGLSADDVAALLNRRPGAVRTSQSRALAHLRRLMEADRVDA